jgi:uncharacterized protein YigE (DUF2233 family)
VAHAAAYLIRRRMNAAPAPARSAPLGRSLLVLVAACSAGAGAMPGGAARGTLEGAEDPLPSSSTPPAGVPADVRVDHDTVVAAAEGFELHQLDWTAGPSAGTAWAARFPRDAALRVHPSGSVQPLAALAHPDAAAWAAINGGFYDASGAMGLVLAGGVEHEALAPRGGSGVVRYDPGSIAILHRDAWVPGSAREALQSIDRIVDRGTVLVRPAAGAHRDARSGVAVADDAVWLVAAAARESIRPGAQGLRLQGTAGRGLTLAEFATLLVDALHAREALNLDGAVSTQMMVAASGWSWGVEGERGTVNAVSLRPPERPAGGER